MLFLLNHADVLLVLGSGPVIVKIVILLQGAPNHPTAAGAFLGMEKVLKELRIDSAGDEMYGSVTVELHDTGGNVVFSAPGTLQAIR